jgi:hypothetical protein
MITSRGMVWRERKRDKEQKNEGREKARDVLARRIRDAYCEVVDPQKSRAAASRKLD